MIDKIISTENLMILLKIVEVFFIVYILTDTIFLFLSMLMSINKNFEDKKKKVLKNEVKHDFYFPISIIVPAFNEEKTIINTIKSLQDLDYKTYEIIVVSDGSTDKTEQKVIENFCLKEVRRPIWQCIKTKKIKKIYEGNITLITKENGGKADSINVGINTSKYGYFVCVDVDYILEKQGLKKLARHVIESGNVIAVASMIRISNDSVFENCNLVKRNLPEKIIPACQVLEHEHTYLASRILRDKHNQNIIIFSAFGLFKKENVINAGGYQPNSLFEDTDLIVKMHSYNKANKLDYKIKYTHEEVCWSKAPETLMDLLKQRGKWQIGLYESLKLDKRIFSKVSYSHYLVFELLSPIIESLGLLFLFLCALLGVMSISHLIMFLTVYSLYGAMLKALSILTRNFVSERKIGKRDMIKAVILSVPETLFFRFIISIAKIWHFFLEIKKFG